MEELEDALPDDDDVSILFNDSDEKFLTYKKKYIPILGAQAS